MIFLVWLSVLLLFAFLVLYLVRALRSDERLPMPALRATLFAGVIAVTAVFVAFTWLTFRATPDATHADRLTPSVRDGRLVWQKYVCVECHTVRGNGANYASDLTGSWSRFLGRSGGDEKAARAAMIALLEHPPAPSATTRGMPQFRMSRGEADSLVEFLRWTSAHRPTGERLFASSGCTSCHSIGKGPVQGPDLANVAKRLDRETIVAFITDPRSVYEREGHAPVNDGYPAMPVLGVAPTDAGAIADFLIGGQS